VPYFTLNRNYALSTTKGHSVNFKKGEKVWVPAAIAQEALAIGAISETPIDVLSDEEKALNPSAEKRKELAFAAFDKLILRGARGDFSASGQPSPVKVNEICGFELDPKERETLWVAYNAKKAEEANQK
jgi:hypothetical protein